MKLKIRLIIALFASGVLSLGAHSEGSRESMNAGDYGDLLATLRSFCASNDTMNIRLTLEHLTNSVKTSADTKLLSAACDALTQCQLADSGEQRRLLRDTATFAVLSGKNDPQTKVHLVTSFLRVGRQEAKTEQEWSATRKASAILWLAVLREIERGIDQTWHEEDPQNYVSPYSPPAGIPAPPSGSPPEALKDPRAKAEYEKYLAKRDQVAVRNYEQKSLRRFKTEYAATVVGYLSGIYSSASSADTQEVQEVVSQILDPNLRASIQAAIAGGGKP